MTRGRSSFLRPILLEDSRLTRSRGFSLIEVLIVVAITLVIIALAAPQLRTAVNNYRINGTARQIQAVAQLARVKATSGNTRYRVHRDTDAATSAGTYELQRCMDSATSRTNPCATWQLDATAAVTFLPTGVTFSTYGISAGPPIAPGAPVQATDVVFNSRGLLFDETALPNGAPASNRCFYLAGTKTRAVAVCSVLTGRTVLYRLYGSAWELQ